MALDNNNTEENSRERIDSMDKKKKALRLLSKEMCERRNANLQKKDYIVTLHHRGMMMFGDEDGSRMAPDTFGQHRVMSLAEIGVLLTKGLTYWTHPDLSNPNVNNEDIPHDEKKWGTYEDIVIEPLAEHLEKSYVESSKMGYFETNRRIQNGEFD